MLESMVITAQTNQVRTLTLNRPLALNSFNAAMHEQLMAALEAAAADDSVRCLILTGAGRAFCAGQDLSDPEVAPEVAPGAPPKDLGTVLERRYVPLLLRLRSMPVPVIAAVNGVAAGAGANLALACDLVFAARSANFIQAFVKIGLIPDTGGSWLLPHLVGRAQAMGLALLGDKLPAAEAQQRGLIWLCVDDDALADEVQATAHRLASMPVKAIVAAREALDGALQLDLAGALAEEARHQRKLGFAHDYQEGVSAFLAKRMPAFTDR